ncbi:hypothetical protein Agub_g12197, partial [Astrephomene gubernaculifera]
AEGAGVAITDWLSYYRWARLPLESPAALLLHFPLTLYGILRLVLDELYDNSGGGSSACRMPTRVRAPSQHLGQQETRQELCQVLPLVRGRNLQGLGQSQDKVVDIDNVVVASTNGVRSSNEGLAGSHEGDPDPGSTNSGHGGCAATDLSSNAVLARNTGEGDTGDAAAAAAAAPGFDGVREQPAVKRRRVGAGRPACPTSGWLGVAAVSSPLPPQPAPPAQQQQWPPCQTDGGSEAGEEDGGRGFATHGSDGCGGRRGRRSGWRRVEVLYLGPQIELDQLDILACSLLPLLPGACSLLLHLVGPDVPASLHGTTALYGGDGGVGSGGCGGWMG